MLPELYKSKLCVELFCEEIVFTAMLPEPSRFTKEFAVAFAVADCVSLTLVAIAAAVFPPTVATTVVETKPVTSPDNGVEACKAPTIRGSSPAATVLAVVPTLIVNKASTVGLFEGGAPATDK